MRLNRRNLRSRNARVGLRQRASSGDYSWERVDATRFTHLLVGVRASSGMVVELEWVESKARGVRQAEAARRIPIWAELRLLPVTVVEKVG